MRMRKIHQPDLEIVPPAPRAARKGSTKSRKSSSSHRRPLLLDYKTWLALTNKVAEVGPK